MKKFILPLLALAGMVLGFSLSSCGGGGGSVYKIAGTLISANGQCVYELYIGERYGNLGAYKGYIRDEQGNNASDIMIALTNIEVDDKGLLSYCHGSISPTSLDAARRKALSIIVMGLDITDSRIQSVTMPSAPRFVFNAKDKTKPTLSWEASAEFDYVLDNSTEEKTIDESREDDVIWVRRE